MKKPQLRLSGRARPFNTPEPVSMTFPLLVKLFCTHVTYQILISYFINSISEKEIENNILKINQYYELTIKNEIFIKWPGYCLFRVVFFKPMHDREYTSTDLTDCLDSTCPTVTVTVSGGDSTDSDCISRAYPKYQRESSDVSLVCVIKTSQNLVVILPCYMYMFINMI